MRSLMIILLATHLTSHVFALNTVSDPLKDGPWTKVISCGNNSDLVVDVNPYNNYQIVVRNELIEPFKEVRSSNSKNEIIIQNVTYYGPNGCSIPEMARQTFVQWNDEGNTAIKLTSDHSLIVTIYKGNNKVEKELNNCSIPHWMIQQ